MSTPSAILIAHWQQQFLAAAFISLFISLTGFGLFVLLFTLRSGRGRPALPSAQRGRGRWIALVDTVSTKAIRKS